MAGYLLDRIHTHNGYYSPYQKDIIPSATTWMNLKDIVLSKISQTQKDKHAMIALV